MPLLTPSLSRFLPVFAVAAMLALLGPAWTARAGEGRVYVVDGASRHAADGNPGTAERPLKTINAAAQLAGPGDTVLVNAGIYRERVTPARGGEARRPVVYRAAPGARVEVKGSEICAAWGPHPDFPAVMSAGIAPLVPAGTINPYLRGVSIGPDDEEPVVRPSTAAVLPQTLGQVFLDGAPLIQVTSVEAVRTQPNTWIVSPDGSQLWAHFTVPAAELPLHTVEVTVRNRIFAPYRRGLSYIHVQGFTFEHCANQGSFPQGGAVSPRSGSYWRIEGNVIRLARTVGLDVGSETWRTDRLAETHPDDRRRIEGGRHVVEGNTISDNGLGGIAGWHHNGVVIRNNVIERNHTGDFAQGAEAKWEEWAGIKLHGQGGLIEGNLIRDNEAFGIWLDNDVSGARITRNVVLNNRMAGIFIELSAGACLIDTNIVAGSRPRGTFYDGMGIYAHDASDVCVAHNLIVENAGGGVVMRAVSDRTFGGRPVASSRGQVLNNIIWNNSKPAISLPFENERGAGNVSDHNLLNGLPDYFQGYRPHQQLFAINLFKNSRTIDDALADLRARLSAAAVPAEQWPNLTYWRWHPFLSLEHWRLLTGQDKHSAEPWKGIEPILRTRDLTLTASVAAGVLRMNGPRIAGVDFDFQGRPLVAGRLLPGPFQTLTETRRDYVLFPVLPAPDAAAAASPPSR